MGERRDSCAVLLIGENPIETADVQQELLDARPDTRVEIARNTNDISRLAAALPSCTLAIAVPEHAEDTEWLTYMKGLPSLGHVRVVAMLRPELLPNARAFYLRGVCSVLPWPADRASRLENAHRVAEYWLDVNVPCPTAPLVASMI